MATKIIKIGTLDYETHRDFDSSCGEETCAFWDNCCGQCDEYSVSDSYFKLVQKEPEPIYPNANPHMDMIIAWAKDTTLKVEYSIDGEKWYECAEPLWSTNYKYRFAPKPKTFFLGVVSEGDELVVSTSDEQHADIKVVMVEGRLVGVEKIAPTVL